MSKTVSYRVLIRGIEKIYFKISLIVLHKRMDNYHKQASHSKKEYANDIRSPLLECADILIVNNPDNPEVIHAIDCTTAESATTNWHTHEKHHAATDLDNQAAFNHEHVGELSKYFRDRGRSSDLHPGIKEKLEHSVWEHIHATIRYARQGDDRSSKMHAGIASYACKELAHYLNQEDYQAFATEVEEHLNILKSSPQIENA